tara:strand:+ start:121 stop:345 length:225 start_codon:yes stop_codon:yes gene_type:complete
VKDNIIKIINKISDCDQKTIVKSKDLLKDGILDSFSTLILLNEIEKEYKLNLKFNDNLLKNFKNVESISKLLQK